MRNGIAQESTRRLRHCFQSGDLDYPVVTDFVAPRQAPLKLCTALPVKRHRKPDNEQVDPLNAHEAERAAHQSEVFVGEYVGSSRFRTEKVDWARAASGPTSYLSFPTGIRTVLRCARGSTARSRSDAVGASDGNESQMMRSPSIPATYLVFRYPTSIARTILSTCCSGNDLSSSKRITRVRVWSRPNRLRFWASFRLEMSQTCRNRHLHSSVSPSSTQTCRNRVVCDTFDLPSACRPPFAQWRSCRVRHMRSEQESCKTEVGGNCVNRGFQGWLQEKKGYQTNSCNQ